MLPFAFLTFFKCDFLNKKQFRNIFLIESFLVINLNFNYYEHQKIEKRT